MSNAANTSPENIDFVQNGMRYQASPFSTTPDGAPIYWVQPYGVRGGLLKKHRPGVMRDGVIVMRGAWLPC